MSTDTCRVDVTSLDRLTSRFYTDTVVPPPTYHTLICHCMYAQTVPEYNAYLNRKEFNYVPRRNYVKGPQSILPHHYATERTYNDRILTSQLILERRNNNRSPLMFVPGSRGTSLYSSNDCRDCDRATLRVSPFLVVQKSLQPVHYGTSTPVSRLSVPASDLMEQTKSLWKSPFCKTRFLTVWTGGEYVRLSLSRPK